MAIFRDFRGVFEDATRNRQNRFSVLCLFAISSVLTAPCDVIGSAVSRRSQEAVQADEVISSACAAWRRLATGWNDLEGTITKELIAKNPAGKVVDKLDAQFDFKRTSMGGLIDGTTSSMHLYKSLETVFLRNSRYIAEIERLADGSGYSLVKFEPIDGSIVQDRLMDDDSVWRIAVPISYMEGRIDWVRVFEHPTFRVVSVARQKELTELKFEALIPDPADESSESSNVILGGSIELDEMRSWVPRRFVVNRGTKAGGVFTIDSVEYQYSETGDLLPVARVRSSKGGPAFPASRAGWTEVVKWSLSTRPVTALPKEQEFRLTAYGVPEPHIAPSRGQLFRRYSLWLLMAALSCFSLFLIFRKKKV